MIPVTTVRRFVAVEVCDLDTDNRARREFQVDAPIDESGQRDQLARIVAAEHPDARMRSFGNLAASFLDRQHLIVAHYGPPLQAADDHQSRAASGQVQQPLFAA